MSESLHTWYSLRDLESFGARHVELGGEIPLARLGRLTESLDTDEGSVKASLKFGRDAGWVTCELAVRSTLRVVCQRCLEPLTLEVDERVELAVVESPALAASVPARYEPLVLEGDRVMPAQLVEDELIVSLPLVPKHANIADCGAAARALLGSAPVQ
ncbi:MAG TPA: YceD family protein [Gammaproteobacteria bacterium]